MIWRKHILRGGTLAHKCLRALTIFRKASYCGMFWWWLIDRNYSDVAIMGMAFAALAWFLVALVRLVTKAVYFVISWHAENNQQSQEADDAQVSIQGGSMAADGCSVIPEFRPSVVSAKMRRQLNM